MSNDKRNDKKLSKEKPLPKHLEHVNCWAAGIDVGSTSHFVAVPEGCAETTVREFKSFTADLNVLADWLISRSSVRVGVSAPRKVLKNQQFTRHQM